MATTDDLIRQLSRDVPPAAPLPGPWACAAAWAAGAAIYVAAVVVWMTPPDRWTTPWSDATFALQQLAAFATALTAAAAAFSMTIPGRGREALLAAAVSAGAWLGLVVSGCIQDWVAAGGAGLALGADWPCAIGIPLAALVPGLALAAMLRRGAPLVPRATTATAAVAVTSLASLGMCLAQPHDRDFTVLVWHGATITVVSILAALAGRSVLNWRRLLNAGAMLLALIVTSPAGLPRG